MSDQDKDLEQEIIEKEQTDDAPDTNKDEKDGYEDICYICRRPESKAGKMIKIPNNICICRDCMQKTFDSMSGSADGTSADYAAGAVDSDAMAGPGEGSGSGRAAVKKKKSGFAAFWSDFGYLIVTAVVVVLVFRVLLQLSWVPSGSMETTIPKKTLLISWQLPYVMGDPVPERGNIVTFWSDELDKLLVKRVIGLPGDTVSFSGGYVYINGQRLEEDYLDQQGGTISPNQTSFTVPEGCLFFLGDNRSGSNDARYWEESYIPVGNVKARVLLAISLTGGSSWQGVRAIG